MDSMDLEREKGITILAKNTSVDHDGRQAQHHRHPRPRRLRRRGRARADDGRRHPAARRRLRGPAAADPLRPPQGARAPPAGDPRRSTRSTARTPASPRSSTRSTSSSSTSTPRSRRSSSRSSTRTPRTGWASLTEGEEGTDLKPLMDLMVEHIPAPEYDPEHPLQALVTNLDASPYVGRLALCRVHHGTIRAGQPIAWCRADGTITRANVTTLYTTQNLERVETDGGRAGRDHRRRRPRGGDDRRDARRPRGPAPAARHHRRRAVALDDGRHQHLPARRPRRQQADRPPDLRPPPAGAGRQRLDPRQRHRAPRRLGGPGPRRAAARRAARDDAPRGLRADRRPAAGRHPRGRRQDLRAGRAPRDRRPRGLRRRRHPGARRPQGPDGADGQPLRPAGSASSSSCPPAA